MPDRRQHDLPGFRGETIRTPATRVMVGDFVVTRYAGQDRLAFCCKITRTGILYVRLYLDLTRTWGPAFQLCGQCGRLDVVQEGAQLPPRPRVWQGAGARARELRPPAALVGA